MAGINFIGSYSGIDGSMIDKLMEAEKMPLVQLSNKKTSITEKQNAWRDINTRLNSLFDKIKTLQSSSTFTSKTAKSTNENIVTMSAGTSATEGTYDIYVKQLATNSRIIGGKVLEEDQKITDALGKSGTFTIENADGKSIEIKVDTDDSLKDIVKKINEGLTTPEDNKAGEKIGIKASIVDGRIVLTDEKSGARDITLSAVVDEAANSGEESQDTILSQLKLSEFVDEHNKGQQSIFTINGIEVTKDSNAISDVIEGVTINLHKKHDEGQYDTVTINLDTEKTTKAVQDFVDQYNSTIKFIEDKMAAGDPEVPGSKGTLAGDSSLMRLHSSLRNLVTSSISKEKGEITDISQLGVSTIDKFGQLQFDSSKFKEALGDDPQKIMDFFSSKNDKGEEIGFVPRLNNYIDSFISKSNGIIKTKTESYDKTIKDLNNQIDRFNDRMERKEQYYIKMFSALDVAMMQAESQMSWLEGQINAMSNSVKK